jgi:hypothetical protein
VVYYIYLETKEENEMNEMLDRNQFREIFEMCKSFYEGDVQEESLEDRVGFEYGDMARYVAMPFAYECILKGMNVSEATDVAFPRNTLSLDQETFMRNVANEVFEDYVEEDEEVQVDVTPVDPSVTPPVEVVEETPVEVRKVRKASSESLSGRAQPLYEEMFARNPNIKNVEAQRAIASELGIDDPKQLNSLRALIVKFKKNLK